MFNRIDFIIRFNKEVIVDGIEISKIHNTCLFINNNLSSQHTTYSQMKEFFAAYNRNIDDFLFYFNECKIESQLDKKIESIRLCEVVNNINGDIKIYAIEACT